MTTPIKHINDCVYMGSANKCLHAQRCGLKCFVRNTDVCTLNDSEYYTLRVNDAVVQQGLPKPRGKKKAAPPPPPNAPAKVATPPPPPPPC